MDVPTLNLLFRSILTFTSVWNTGETGDMYYQNKLNLNYFRTSLRGHKIYGIRHFSNSAFLCRISLKLYFAEFQRGVVFVSTFSKTYKLLTAPSFSRKSLWCCYFSMSRIIENATYEYFILVLKFYCVLNNNAFKLFSGEHII